MEGRGGEPRSPFSVYDTMVFPFFIIGSMLHIRALEEGRVTHSHLLKNYSLWLIFGITNIQFYFSTSTASKVSYPEIRFMSQRFLSSKL